MVTKASSKISAVANFFKRLSSLLSIALGGYFGYWIAEIVFSLLSMILSAKKMGAVWGSGVAAVIAIWKSAIHATESIISAWWYIKQRNAHFDHTKALFGIATIVFGIVLGYRTFFPGFKPEVTSPEFVYIVSHQGRVAPYFIVAPSLLFASAGLRDPNIENFSDANKIREDFFEDYSVSLTDRQVNSISILASKLASKCIYDGADVALALKVYGFANDLPILNGKREPRQDSDILNLAIANLRGRSLYKEFSDFFAKSFPDLSEEVSIDWKPWKSLGEMQDFRDTEIFKILQIAPSPSIDHRSALIVVSNPGTCTQLDFPQGK